MSKQQSVIRNYVQTLIDTTINTGVTLHDLLDGLALTEEDLKQPNFRLEMDVMTQLWMRAVELTDDPSLSLHVGEHMQLGSLHAFGPIAMNCPTLGTTIKYMIQYSRIVSEGGSLSCNQLDQSCHIEYQPNDGLYALTRHQIEGVLSTLIGIARMISTNDLNPQAVFSSTMCHAQVAERLNLSLRSLQRKLKTEHSSYQDILDTYRQEQSIHLFTNTHWSIATIAEHLSYLNLSSYHRAFKR
ncbi:AraC family transcriptional regulator ligand-binding domain-containing protein [Litoribrevibacter euphylliae]|uniref:AraC family transcriptional regulator ligand-binding domain-containing protein n=1 Tax=Litoribrevibacter euphylliae TaxID=1834034 RepID=A0ABV7HI18_9GAMM